MPSPRRVALVRDRQGIHDGRRESRAGSVGEPQHATHGPLWVSVRKGSAKPLGARVSTARHGRGRKSCPRRGWSATANWGKCLRPGEKAVRSVTESLFHSVFYAASGDCVI